MSLISDVRADFRKLTINEKSVRSFAFVMSGALTVLGAAIFFFGSVRDRALWFFGAAVLFALLQAVRPLLLKPLYVVWMLLSLVLGWFMSRLLLTLIFFLVITPIGLIMRLFGKDLLSLRIDRHAQTYWLKRSAHARPPESYDRLF